MNFVKTFIFDEKDIATSMVYDNCGFYRACNNNGYDDDYIALLTYEQLKELKIAVFEEAIKIMKEDK